MTNPTVALPLTLGNGSRSNEHLSTENVWAANKHLFECLSSFQCVCVLKSYTGTSGLLYRKPLVALAAKQVMVWTGVNLLKNCLGV